MNPIQNCPTCGRLTVDWRVGIALILSPVLMFGALVIGMVTGLPEYMRPAVRKPTAEERAAIRANKTKHRTRDPE